MNRQEELPISALVPSRTNRKMFDSSKLEELAENIKTVGLQQPPLVRPIKEGLDGSERYEIVFGERRWRACKLAEIEKIPCFIKELSDRQAAEIQLVENLQREDVDMVEEAQILRRMLDLKENGSSVYNAASLAVRIGKSREYVSHRLQFVNLPRQAKDALRAGKLPPTTAVMIGRLPNLEARKEVTKAVLELGLNWQATKELIQREYMRSLKSAPFSRECTELCPAAGSCDACPKRTGNMDLDNVKDGWVCCDPDCYAEKAEAAWQLHTEVARARGEEVLSDEESRRIFPDGRNLAYDSPYVILSARPPEDIIKPDVIWRDLESWEKMLDDAVQPVVARVPDTGRAVDLAKLEHCLTAAVEQGHGELFKDAILRRYAAAAPVGEHRTSKVEDRTSNGEREPTKGEKSQRDAMRDLNALRQQVADLFFDDCLSVDPAEVDGGSPIWQLLLQAATINVGAAGRKLIYSWFNEDDEAWSFAVAGRYNYEPKDMLKRLLALLVAEWEPHMQDKFLGLLAVYIEAEVGEGEEAEFTRPDLGEPWKGEIPEGYRPAHLALPDDEVTCKLIVADVNEDLSEGLGYTSTDEKENVVWIDAVSFEAIEGKVVGWEYYDSDEEEESA